MEKESALHLTWTCTKAHAWLTQATRLWSSCCFAQLVVSPSRCMSRLLHCAAEREEQGLICCKLLVPWPKAHIVALLSMQLWWAQVPDVQRACVKLWLLEEHATVRGLLQAVPWCFSLLPPMGKPLLLAWSCSKIPHREARQMHSWKRNPPVHQIINAETPFGTKSNYSLCLWHLCNLF